MQSKKEDFTPLMCSGASFFFIKTNFSSIKTPDLTKKWIKYFFRNHENITFFVPHSSLLVFYRL
jgi:hypothetical protein